MNKTKAIIVDLDGTLSDCRSRIKYAVNKEWKEFYGRLGEDEPNPYVRILVRHLQQQMSDKYEIIYLTGRPEEYRRETENWLKKYDLSADLLYMRETDDFRPDADIKLEIFNSKIKPNFNVKLVLEDRSRVVKMWRSIGLECWQVAGGDF